MVALVACFHSKNAWVTTWLSTEWFHENFVPEHVFYQKKKLKVIRSQVRALILPVNTPAHPAASELISKNGRVKIMYFPSNTATNLIQPMGQGVIVSAKKHYRRGFLDEAMFEVEEKEEAMLELDTGGERTLENIRSYNIWSAIFKWAPSREDVPPKTLETA